MKVRFLRGAPTSLGPPILVLGAGPREYATAILAREVPVESLLKHDEAALLTDDRPYNEYYLLRRAWNRVDGSDRDIY